MYIYIYTYIYIYIYIYTHTYTYIYIYIYIYILLYIYIYIYILVASEDGPSEGMATAWLRKMAWGKMAAADWQCNVCIDPCLRASRMFSYSSFSAWLATQLFKLLRRGPDSQAIQLDSCSALTQGSTELALGRSALSVCPCGDPWGTLIQLEITYSWATLKPPGVQTLRSPRPKVTSALTRFLTCFRIADRVFQRWNI